MVILSACGAAPVAENWPGLTVEGGSVYVISGTGKVVSFDAKTGRSKRFAHIEMATPAEAQAAINQLNMTQYDEVVMSVSKVKA